MTYATDSAAVHEYWEPEPARGAITVDILTTSAVIEVARTVSRDGCIGIGGHKVLLESTLVGQRVAVRLEGALMHVVANGRWSRRCPRRYRRISARSYGNRETHIGAFVLTNVT